MRRPTHTRFFNFFFNFALLMIVLVFCAAGYMLATGDFSINSATGQDARSAVLLVGTAVGLLALLTGVFYLVGQLDSRSVQDNRAEQEQERTVRTR